MSFVELKTDEERWDHIFAALEPLAAEWVRTQINRFAALRVAFDERELALFATELEIGALRLLVRSLLRDSEALGTAVMREQEAVFADRIEWPIAERLDAVRLKAGELAGLPTNDLDELDDDDDKPTQNATKTVHAKSS